MTRPKRALPDPLELAKLAILLRQNLNTLPADAIKGAMELWIEAVILCGECAGLSFEELTAKFRNKRQLAIERGKKADQARWQDALELDPAKQSDPARDYLGEHGLCLKTAEKVLDHVCTAWNARRPDLIPDSFDILAHCKRSLNGKTIYLIPRFLLGLAVTISKNNRKRSRQKSRTKSSRRKPVK